jgi:hypothetical protein
VSAELPLLLALMLAAPVSDAVGTDRVVITGQRLTSLADGPEPPRVEAWAQRRVLRVQVQPDGISLRGRWTIAATRATWFAGGLFEPGVHIRSATWNGAPAALWDGSQGVLVVGRVDAKGAVLEVDAFVPGATVRELAVLGATVGEIELVADEPLRVVASEGAPVLLERGRFRTGHAALKLERPEAAPPDDRTIAIAHTGIGLTVGDDALRGKAHVRWVVRKGSLDALEIDAANLGEDLELEGVNVESWKRDGKRIHIVLREATRTSVDVQLTWSVALPKQAESELPLPVIEPQSVFRSESSLQVARDGEVDSVPNVGGWQTIATALVPEWGEGLVEGAPTAAFRRAGSGYKGKGALELYRFEAVPGPPLVVEIGDLSMATSVEGRTLLRARYELRNERAPHLEVRPPRGMKLVGAWVSGEEVRASLVDGAWRIPVPRSIETLEGLITFPVVVAMLGEGQAWRRREKREVELPIVDAPVNVVRVTMHLPLSYRSKLDPGDGPVVAAFTRGEEVGFGLADEKLRVQADDHFRRAVDYWNENDFDNARRELDELDKLGAKSKNQSGLRSNVDAVSVSNAPARGSEAVVQSLPGVSMSKVEQQRLRRIKGNVRARATKLRERQRELKKKAKQYKAEGDYNAAAAEYEKALDETRQLEQLEDDEAAEYEFEEEEIEGELEDTRVQQKARASLESSAVKKFHADMDELPMVLVDDPPPPPPVAGPPVVIPTAGRAVHYQYLLLEPGARRTVPVHARHAPQARRKRR